MKSVTFLNENEGSLPFREELLDRISLLNRQAQLFVAFELADLEIARPDTETPTLLLLIDKDVIVLSPLYQPGKSVCFGCLHHWLKLGNDRLGPRTSCLGMEEARVAAELVSHALREDSLSDVRLRTAIQTFCLATGKRGVHPVYPLRGCQRCSLADVSEAWGLRIHCSSITGIVPRMQITNTAVAGAYRAVATWRSPLPVENARPLLHAQESHGRGRTREEAENGCIGEALERYSVIYRGDERLQRGRLSEVSGIDPRDILLYSEQQYESREQWNQSTDERYFVGERFDPDQEIDWFPGIDLVDGSRKMLPAACVLMWYSFQPGESEYARGDSIGCGSGWTFDDALSHALLEWIERDAMAIWWYNRIQRPAVRLESFKIPELLQVREDLGRAGRDLILLDCTSDLGIPTYVSVAPRLDGTEILFAGASHVSPRVAAWKAASEVGQIWFSAVHKQAIDVELKDWLKESIDSQPYLSPTHYIDARDEPSLLRSSEAVKIIVDRLMIAGLQPYAADLSRPDVVLKTARAVVPGLRHIWNRRGPGRLYEVPVRLGWTNAPLREDQLNPICCMI